MPRKASSKGHRAKKSKRAKRKTPLPQIVLGSHLEGRAAAPRKGGARPKPRLLYWLTEYQFDKDDNVVRAVSTPVFEEPAPAAAPPSRRGRKVRRRRKAK